MTGTARIRRAGSVSMSKALACHQGHLADSVGDALRASGMVAGDSYYVQVRVIEILPDDPDQDDPQPTR